MTLTVDLNRPHPDLVSVHIGDAPLDTTMVISVARRTTEPVPISSQSGATRAPHPTPDQAERDTITWEDAEWR